jgi:O-antigen ligase
MGVVCELGLGTFQPWLSDYRFSGTLHPNTQGVYLATALFAALALCKLDPPRWIAYAAIMLVGFTLLVLTKSRTSTAGVMLTWGCLWLALQRPALRVLLPAAGLYCMAVGLLLGGLLGVPLEQHFAKLALLGREEQAESFSGRTTIWPVVTEFIEQRYWFGHGYDSFWTPDAIAAVTEACQWPVREAHSAYYETMLHLGLVGLLLLLVMVLTALGTSVWGAWWSREPAAYLFWAAMLTNGLFNGLFESGIVMITLPTTLIAAGLMRLALVREAVARQAPRKGAAWSAQLFWQRSFAT